jgi:hypothetical protein
VVVAGRHSHLRRPATCVRIFKIYFQQQNVIFI